MGEFRQTALVFVSTLALSGLGLTLVAQAQNSPSPFSKKGTQAWEKGAAAPASAPATSQSGYSYPNVATTQPQYQSRSTQQPAAESGAYQPSGNLAAPAASAPTKAYPSTYNYSLPSTNESAPISYPVQPASVAASGGTPYPSTYKGPAPVQTQHAAPSQASGTYSPGASYDYPSYQRHGAQAAPSQPALRPASQASHASGAYYPGRATQPHMMSQTYGAQTAQGQPYPPQGQPYPNQSRPNQGPMIQPRGPRTFAQKMGLDNVAFLYEGYVRSGAAATYHDPNDLDHGWREDFILDGSLRAEVSAITPGGLEYGIAGKVRGQYDQYRRGFGGLVGDCPAGVAGCNSVNVGGTDYVLRGHTSRFYASGVDDAKDFEAQLEGAHLFLRSGYGDVTLGRDDGAAYLFSLGAPTLLNVGASNNSVDYTGLDAVKTLNDASGFSEKITYTSPRLLGDNVGVGIQFGASYALDAEACGVDYCVRGNNDEPAGVLGADLEDIAEFGIALDRKFANGLSVEATGTYARGSEQSGLAVFDDLESYGLALELGYGDFILGGSYLASNNALANGDYKAMDIGLTWQPSRLGFTVGYGHAEDDNVGLTSDQAVVGVSYDWRENVRFSTGLQYVNRDVNVNNLGLVSGQNEDATSVFVEGRFTF
ncbi:MAG: porin [Hellea sp.]|nr:porin [Hellea sp.]